MKSIYLTILLLFFFKGFYAQDITEEAINELMKQGGYSPKTMQYGKLKESEAMFREFMFEKDKSYFVIAYGEEGVLDVDIEMLNNMNQILTKDKDSEPLALVKYDPSENQYLKIIVKNFNSQSRNHAYVIKYLIYYKSTEDSEKEKEVLNTPD